MQVGFTRVAHAGSALMCSKLCHVTLYQKMACKCGEKSGATAFCSESNREGTNILVVIGTMHIGMKDVRTKATLITLASCGVGQLKNLLRRVRRIMNNSMVQPFSGSKSADRLQLLGMYRWVEKHLNRVAVCLEMLRILVRGSLEGFCMYTHYGHGGAIPTQRVYRLSDNDHPMQEKCSLKLGYSNVWTLEALL